MRTYNAFESVMYHNFLVAYPDYLPHVIDYYYWDEHQLRVELDDGRTALWNDITQAGTFYDPGDRSLDDKDSFYSEFGYRLEIMMLNRGYTRTELSTRSGIDYHTLTNYIDGRRTPSILNAVKLARALDCSVDDLLYFIREFN